MLRESIATRLLPVPPFPSSSSCFRLLRLPQIHHDLFHYLALLLLWLDAAQTRETRMLLAGHVVFAVGMLPHHPPHMPYYFTVYMLLTQHKMLRSAQARERERDVCHDLYFKGTNSNVDAVWMLRECALQMAPHKHSKCCANRSTGVQERETEGERATAVKFSRN